MAGERIVFTEEGQPNQYLKLIASGDVDAVLLEALEDFVKRQKKRLSVPANPATPSVGSESGVSFMITHAQRTQLLNMGVPEEEIRRMTPEEAHHRIATKRTVQG